MCEPVSWGPTLLTGLENQSEGLSSPSNNLSLLQGAAQSKEVSEASNFTSWAGRAEMKVEVLPRGARSFLRELFGFLLRLA